MRIERVKLHNFRIYRGVNEVVLHNHEDRNISLIAGKNGFGKTTFLTSLIWALYGNLMSQVEDKYRVDIKSAGGYDKFVERLLNRSVKYDFENEHNGTPKFSVEVHLMDVLIPSIPCRKLVVRRSYDLRSRKEKLEILIDGSENELTKEVGYDVFINDFILPREIAKFFFFDAEKIVTLAEAKSKSELRSLSRAYSEVLGIKKYEDLKQNLKTLLTKLRRAGVSEVNQGKLKELESTEIQLSELIDINRENQLQLEEEISSVRNRIDGIQEKLIREGSGVSLEELNELKKERDKLREEHIQSKNELKKFMEIVPIVIGFKKLEAVVDQLHAEFELKSSGDNADSIRFELEAFRKSLIKEFESISFSKEQLKQIKSISENQLKQRLVRDESDRGNILLDFSDEKAREIIAMYNYIKDSFSHQFKQIVKVEKNASLMLNRVMYKIREAEARKDNALVQKLREDRGVLEKKLESLISEKQDHIEKMGELKAQYASNQKVLSEYEKNYNLVATDKKKYAVTEDLLVKLEVLIRRIKDEKKYSLQKSILLGLNKLMHKGNFVKGVRVRIEDDVMDIDLLDAEKNIIDKDTLSKGEQQLYATALLKALVDESGINFPVFIDSPLQKFDKEHSTNVIRQFYPSISEQVVLFPLLEKELSMIEYDLLLENLNGVYLIENNESGSTIKEYALENLFDAFNSQNYVLAN